MSNGRQVILALNLYAASNKSCFPDTHHPQLKSANEVFRELFCLCNLGRLLFLDLFWSLRWF